MNITNMETSARFLVPVSSIITTATTRLPPSDVQEWGLVNPRNNTLCLHIVHFDHFKYLHYTDLESARTLTLLKDKKVNFLKKNSVNILVEVQFKIKACERFKEFFSAIQRPKLVKKNVQKK